MEKKTAIPFRVTPKEPCEACGFPTDIHTLEFYDGYCEGCHETMHDDSYDEDQQRDNKIHEDLLGF